MGGAQKGKKKLLLTQELKGILSGKDVLSRGYHKRQVRTSVSLISLFHVNVQTTVI